MVHAAVASILLEIPMIKQALHVVILMPVMILWMDFMMFRFSVIKPHVAKRDLGNHDWGIFEAWNIGAIFREFKFLNEDGIDPECVKMAESYRRKILFVLLSSLTAALILICL